MFANVISDRIDIDNKMMAALYLLTADKFLWPKVRRCVCGSQINFAAVNLGSASPEAYTLFMTARDICEGTRYITVSDLSDRELVSHKMFGLITNAMAIRRYGLAAVVIIEADADLSIGGISR